MLKTIVKVSQITNLSDARYCSGMGVDMLGFNVVEGTDGYVSPSLFQELRGWFSGPKIVAEVYGLNSVNVLPSIMENYRPDFLEMGLSEYALVKDKITLPVIFRVNDELTSLPILPNNSFILRKNSTFDQLGYQTLVDTENDCKIAEKVLRIANAGIVVHGTPEISTGQKSYEGLADTLEFLSVD